ncbi:MAG: sugar ABC transporter permease [Caldilineaceae bacterium SB0670_bin_27]|uniref:Sugar ABC transporter permease n=1 Tax=Caldilineaceae bacterium SB0664_bin_27 TaxID=2605260 RepID=A0A6B0YX17_9CHLR|nr:sugar ABC transporter permease [Caldilineaceae bacterium]MDE0340105.1 sugar ABC transporter permease [Caldilineaceae bacterium]MXY94292.1 sugar ABC transporter permease [Caldilineaceae bacterium SB0664_bin_27]MYJ79116.1 sugar ABC transporter permease [Caldilineaceae bacterium SB0670_bin_27]
MNKTLWERIWETRTGYLMVVPTLAFLLVFQYYPAVSGLYRSMFDWNAGLAGNFIGLSNFVELFTDDDVFIRSLKNMALLTIWYLVAFVGLSTGVAVLIHRIRNEGSKYFFRLFMILPVIIPAVVLILLWKFIYDSTIGPLNAILIGVGLQDWTHAWLAEPKIAIYAVMFRNFPWIDGVSVLILLAGLQAIPVEIVESGLLDGASGWRRLRYIELPLITGQIKLLIVLTIMWGVQEYSAVWAMTQGGPIDSTQVPGMWMYFNAFRISRMGYASAIGVVMFLITLVATILNMRYIRSQEY